MAFQIFFVVYVSLTLNSPVKIYSIIHANKKLYYTNIATHTAKIIKLQEKILLHILYINFLQINFMYEFNSIANIKGSI